jgi:hypothetical protein
MHGMPPFPLTAHAAVAMAALGVVTLHAQEIRVAENVRVARGPETRPLVEPHLAVHPTNPNHLLAAAIVGDTAEAFSDKQTCSSFLSTDGGRTWQRHDFQVRACADPWVAVTPRGAAVFVALAKQQDAGGRATVGLVAFHSADGVKTWSPLHHGCRRSSARKGTRRIGLLLWPATLPGCAGRTPITRASYNAVELARTSERR